MKGDIEPGDMVIFRDDIGELKEGTETSMTICLEPWQYNRVYSPPKKARMTRLEQSLDECD